MSTLGYGLLISITVLVCCTYGTTENTLYNLPQKKIGLICDVDIHDFGQIGISDAADCTHSFLLQNTSSHIISLLSQSSSSCSCTSYELPREFVGPGEYVTIDVNVDWSSRAGQQEETVLLKTDDTETPEIKLIVRGFVVKHAILSTHSLDFGELKPGTKKTHIVKLLQGADTTFFRILKIDNPNNYISIVRTDTSGKGDPNLPLGGGPGDFAITFATPKARGQYDSTIVFYTDIEDQAELSVSIEASSVGVFTIEPKTLFFPECHFGKEALQDVRIDSEAAGITSVAVTSSSHEKASPFYIKRIHNRKSENVLTAVVTVGFMPPEANATVCQATLHISFGEEVINVPIIAMSKKHSEI